MCMLENDKIHDECGVFGIHTGTDRTINVVSAAYYGLYALQHRGQESCGIAVNDDGLITSYKDVGLVNDVFSDTVLNSLGNGSMAIGHVRYSTTGTQSRTNAQPLVVNHIKGCLAVAHNGNLTNASELREKLELEGAIFHSSSDTEVIMYEITRSRLKTASIEEAVSGAMDAIEGAYALVIMSPSKLIGARDPHGFKPLCIGTMAAVLFLPLSPVRSTRSARPFCGMLSRGRLSSSTRPASARLPITAANAPLSFAFLNMFTLPAPIR